MRKSALALSFAALALLTACGGSDASSSSSASASASETTADTTATVTSVVDGATFKAKTADGEDATVKLVNVAAPTTDGETAFDSCQATESTNYLTEQLPANTEVTLKFDAKSKDDDGNLLAAVYKGEDDFINADVVGAGYGVPVKDDDNTYNYATIVDEQTTALSAGKGLFDRSVECTVPATLKNATTALEDASDDTKASALESSKKAYESVENAKENSDIVKGMLNVPAVQMLEDNAQKAIDKAGE